MIKAILIDDEKHCIESLTLDLEKYCPEVTICEALTSSKEGLSAIKKHKPDLLFLDIEMPWMNGFELLEFLNPIDFEVIFVTAYDSYALKAFKASAVDYLMKPVDRNDLIKAVDKVKKRIGNTGLDSGKIHEMLETFFSRKQTKKIIIPEKDSQKFIEPANILYVEAVSNYSKIFIKDKKTMMASLTLKNIEAKLVDHNFLRVHHSYVVNMDEVQQYVKSDGGYLILSNDAVVPISRSKKSELKSILEKDYKL